MPQSKFSFEQVKAYHRDGYLIVKAFCKPEEVARLHSVAVEDEGVKNNALDLNDQTGKKTKLSLWFTPGNDVFGYLSRSEKMVYALTQLLGSDSPICHFHTKLMQKEPKVGGAWEWHQDFGYWYKNQFMFPDQMISVMVALTPATKENGCLQVITGSHKMGRVNHGFAGEQVGADAEMVANALKTMDLLYCELSPGDALFFHSNLMHRSEANLSDGARWSIISCYNLQSNLSYGETTSSWRIPVDVVPDEALLNWKTDNLADNDFLRKENEAALKDTGWEQEVKVK
ncbi:phytanoyl-CoA dioxygenase family protein [Flavitalea flava]